MHRRGRPIRRYALRQLTLTLTTNRAALTGKHDTLVRRAPGWQGAPDGQQAKKLLVTKCLFYIINVLI